MAPTIAATGSVGNQLLQLFSRSFQSMSSRALDDGSPPPLASVFATIIKDAGHLTRRAIREALGPRTSSANEPVYLTSPPSLQKRQGVVLAIPTTYAGLNSGPAPGAVVGITLGAIAGFIVILYIILSAIRLSGWNQREEVIVEEHHHRRSHGRSRSRSRAMTEVSSPRRERIVREREDRVVVEERHMEPDSVIVDEEEDDVVEVIEEHSPVRPPKRDPPRRSGFRTVDPAELGGGGAPRRSLHKR
ncbi:uncharacterized protein A1O9_11550 [Exophiala aquamarina CBS 119918]|uniref:Uncharacterized protein n=1 Tax=Exophiala aquamarina CBS 119918 TaxID=1182545 RepID=A0A072P9V6_9EURO|nr:uncharacterized protein A1O9_11550 [Exophiala aquamarina CBS 119918]KEF52310.1 hypothetical protein A1O9_11550 [Exophiala aquamarina CBS 119918]